MDEVAILYWSVNLKVQIFILIMSLIMIICFRPQISCTNNYIKHCICLVRYIISVIACQATLFKLYELRAIYSIILKWYWSVDFDVQILSINSLKFTLCHKMNNIIILLILQTIINVSDLK